MAVLLQGCCPVHIKTLGPGGKVCKGFFSVSRACKESSNPLLPPSHARGKARSPCLF